MICIAYSLKDTVSTAAGELLRASLGEGKMASASKFTSYGYDGIQLIELKGPHLDADFLEGAVEADVIIFLSRHSSSKEVPAFTVHPEGNWGGEAKLGGKPKELSMAAPVQMLQILNSMASTNRFGVQVTYEATHHGPLLREMPSLYAEVGGNDSVRANKEYIKFLADSVMASVSNEVGYENIALGIGGLHYSDRFAKRALEGKYAFAHIMPRHAVDNVDMIGQAMARSSPKAEVAVIDWKSINDQQRKNAIKKLEELGVDYFKI